ncbi:MAG: hypothetical protein JKY34_08255, partial [Kordiimonadaceae bacterium]|nr:hypothetical protein [Kordiimonadaceae bacterium]
VGVLVALRASGEAVGWGFQLQEPLFVGLLAILMVIVSLSLAGMFHLEFSFQGAGQSLAMKEGYAGSFFKGVLATLVATPCTAPLMAPAIGFAITQSLPVIILVFSLLAFGLALPFLALSYSDRLAKMMPRPGAWMEKVKQGLAFPMLLTAAWLIYVYDIQAGSQATFFLLAGIILLSFGLWLWSQTSHKGGRLVALAALVASLIVVVNVSVTQDTVKELLERMSRPIQARA